MLGTLLGFVVTLDNDCISTQITGGFNWEVNKFLSAQADLTGLLTIFVNFETGELHFVGQVHATGTVKYPGGSKGIDLWAAVGNCALVFDLPVIGIWRFPLPC